MPVTGTSVTTTEFTVNEEGYYMLKFSCQSGGGFEEFLLGAVELITKPSDAAYYKAQLAAAVDSATVVLNAVANEIYNGQTKTALAEALEEAKGTFNSPSAVEAMNASCTVCAVRCWPVRLMWITMIRNCRHCATTWPR